MIIFTREESASIVAALKTVYYLSVIVELPDDEAKLLYEKIEAKENIGLRLCMISDFEKFNLL